MNISAKSLKILVIVFAVLTILTAVWRIVTMLSGYQLYSLPDGLPIIFMLATFGCFAAGRKKKDKESNKD